MPSPASSPFPASEPTPGQQTSRAAYRQLQEKASVSSWWESYLSLRDEGWDWRKAVYIAWAATPSDLREPKTITDLAKNILGLNNTSTIRKWRKKQPEIDQRIETIKTEILSAMTCTAEEILYLLSQRARGARENILKRNENGSYSVDLQAVQSNEHMVKALRETKFGVAITLFDPLPAQVKLGQYHDLFDGDRGDEDRPIIVKVIHGVSMDDL